MSPNGWWDIISEMVGHATALSRLCVTSVLYCWFCTLDQLSWVLVRLWTLPLCQLMYKLFTKLPVFHLKLAIMDFFSLTELFTSCVLRHSSRFTVVQHNNLKIFTSRWCWMKNDYISSWGRMSLPDFMWNHFLSRKRNDWHVHRGPRLCEQPTKSVRAKKGWTQYKTFHIHPAGMLECLLKSQTSSNEICGSCELRSSTSAWHQSTREPLWGERSCWVYM